MRSVRTKISTLVLLCVLVAALLIGGIGLQTSKKVVREDANQLLQLMCSNETSTMNALLSRIEQSVITLSDYAQNNIGSLEQFKTDQAYVRKYSEELERIAVNAATNTEGAMTV